MRRRRLTNPQAAQAQYLDDLLREFEYPDRRFQTDPLPIIPDLVGGGGMAHVLIVSTSEPQEIRDKADYVVEENNCSTALQEIFDVIEDSQLSNGAWSIWMAGVFDLDADITAPAGAWLRGLGWTEAGGGHE